MRGVPLTFDPALLKWVKILSGKIPGVYFTIPVLSFTEYGVPAGWSTALQSCKAQYMDIMSVK